MFFAGAGQHAAGVHRAAGGHHTQEGHHLAHSHLHPQDRVRHSVPADRLPHRGVRGRVDEGDTGPERPGALFRHGEEFIAIEQNKMHNETKREQNKKT